MLTPLSPLEVSERLNTGTVRLVDIRETDEYLKTSIKNTLLLPLSVCGSQSLPRAATPTVFFCNSGHRTTANSELLQKLAGAQAYQMEGGIQAWEKAGLPVEKSGPSLPLFRQIQIIAGSLVLLGVVCSQIWPSALLLSALVGLGLIFAGITGFCGLGILLSKLPWNSPERAGRK